MLIEREPAIFPLSHSAGPRDVPLLGETIGDEPAPHRRALRRPRGARRPPPGLPRDLRRALGRRSTARRARCSRAACGKGDRVGIWAPNRYEWVVTQFATARDRRDPRQRSTRPTRRPSSQYALQQGRRRACSCWRAASATPTTSAMLDEVRGRLPGAARDDRARGRLGRRSWPTARRVGDARAGRARGVAAVRRPDQHPVHLGHDRAPRRARRSRTTTSSTTATSSASALRLHASTTASACPVPFYHCFGMVLGNLACVTHGACMVVPGEAFDAAAVLEAVEAERCTVALRRADDVHRRARAPGLRALRPLEPAHRHHGRRALPGRGDEAGARADAHGRGHDRAAA